MLREVHQRKRKNNTSQKEDLHKKKASGVLGKGSTKAKQGDPIMAQQLMNPTSILEDRGLIPGLAQWVKDPALL